jgi:hypothetical protein
MGELFVTVPQTDTGRLVEYTKVIESSFVKEFGKLTLYLRKKGALPSSDDVGGTEKVQSTVYQKHRPLLKRKLMYRG